MGQSPADQQKIVQRMIDAGESEQNIATVIQHFKTMAPEASHRAPTLQETKIYNESGTLPKGVTKPTGPISHDYNLFPAAGGAIGAIVGGGPAGAALGGTFGESLRQIAQNFQKSPDAPQSGSDMAWRMLKEGALQGLTEGAGRAMAPVLTRVGDTLMQSALKPGVKETAKAFSRGISVEEMPIVQTLKKEGVNVSQAGIAKLDKVINASNDEVAAALKAMPSHPVISPQKVATRVNDVVDRVKMQVNPTADVAAAKDAAKEFLLSRPGGPVGLPNPMSVQEAQAIKQGTYRSLKEKAYGELKAPAIEAQKSLARGLKEEIEAEASKWGIDVTGPNAREGAAITAKEAIAKRLAAAGNRDPIALAWLTHNPVAGLAMVMERSPAVKSALARGAYASAAKAGRVPETVLRLLVQSIATAADDPMQPVASHEVKK